MLKALPGGIAALVLMMGGPIVQAPAQSTAPQTATREFTDPTAKPRRIKHAVANRKDDLLDGAGNYRSSDRLRRKLLVAIAGVPDTGRQWVKLQKVLRRYAPEVLTAHPRVLMQHPAARAAIR